MSPFFTLFDVPPTLTGTIPVFISCCFYRQNLQSSHEFKYPPSKEFYFSLLPVASCFNLLMALLKMLLLVCPITYYILVKFHALEFSYRPYKIERTSKSCILFQDGGSVLLYGPYKYICVSIKCFKLIYFALKYFQIILRPNSTQFNSLYYVIMPIYVNFLYYIYSCICSTFS